MPLCGKLINRWDIMSTIRKSLLQSLFSGFNMRRWNDKLRTTELYEIDKQAHKMIIAFLLCNVVETDSKEQRTELLHNIIEGALFDYFYRLVTTDLKPPLFYKIKENSSHYSKLTAYVEKALEPILKSFSPDFFQRFSDYHNNKIVYSHKLTNQILQASHLYASQWEFNLIKSMNSFDPEISKIEKDFEDKLQKLANEAGLEELKNILNKEHSLGNFASFCGQLRFQVRWSQEPRLPLTTVLGHMFFVGAVAYLVSVDVNACKARKVNNFFCGLFHDLPELLTRDIISPVKNSSEQLPDFIKQYENAELNTRIFNPLEEDGYYNITNALRYILGYEINGEFKPCYTQNEQVHLCTTEELQLNYNEDIYNPKDGELIKACDNLAAFMEAQASIKHGVSSPQLVDASVRIRNEILNPLPNVINFKAILADFD